MKYMMLVCMDPAMEAEAPEGAIEKGVDAWIKKTEGLRLEGRPLNPSDATTIRVRGGETLLSDGPFAETKELMVGYDVLDCKDLDEAIEVAAKHPLASYGAMELRPFGAE